MADTNTRPAWTGPGIIQNFFTIKQGSQLSQETLEKWIDEVYIPEVLATGVVDSVRRYKAIDPSYEKQNMLVKKVPDLARVQAGGLNNVKKTSDLFPTNDPVENFVDVESRILSFLQAYETEKHAEDATTTIIYAAMHPPEGREKFLDDWYREEHLQQMSEQPGWRRTVRWKLLFSHRFDSKPPETIRYLAIHEFGEGHKLGKQVEPLDPMTDWTKQCMEEAVAIDAAMYQKVKYFGSPAE